MKHLQQEDEQEFETFSRICRERGFKLTHQRAEIFRQISGDKGHPSAEDIHRRLKKSLPMVSLDTVYRTLSVFEELGVIQRLHVLDDHARFDSNPELHHHFVCTRCKKIQDFTWPVVDSADLPKPSSDWGRIESRHVELRGACNQCVKEEGRG